MRTRERLGFRDNTVFETKNRMLYYDRLALTAVQKSAVYWINGGVVYLPAGCTVSTLAALEDLWGCSRNVARRALEAFERAGVIKRRDVTTGLPDAGDAPPVPSSKGQLIYLASLVDPLVYENPPHAPRPRGQGSRNPGGPGAGKRKSMSRGM